MAVVTPSELYYLVAAGERSGQPDSAHARLGARTDQSYRFHRGESVADDLGQLDFLLHGRAEASAVLGSLLYGLDHCWMGVP